MNPAQEEIEIWNTMVGGNKESFAHLYNTYYSHLLAYAGKLLNNPILVQECIQDLFVKLWNNKAGLNQPASVKHYLLKALRHLIYNKVKAQQRIKHIGGLEDFDSFHLAFEDTPAAKEAISAELQARINQLTPRQKEIIYLFYVEDLSYDEIAQLMNLNKGGAYKLLYRALENLRIHNF